MMNHRVIQESALYFYFIILLSTCLHSVHVYIYTSFFLSLSLSYIFILSLSYRLSASLFSSLPFRPSACRVQKRGSTKHLRLKYSNSLSGSNVKRERNAKRKELGRFWQSSFARRQARGTINTSCFGMDF